MAVAELKAEVSGKAHKVTWRDTEFTVAPMEDWVFEFQHAIDRQQPTLAIEALLGSEQYEKFRAAKPNVADLQTFINSVVSQFGVTPGE